jgi:predicted DNA-binding transcriptional regulator YafY
LLKELDQQRAGIIVRGGAAKDYTSKQGILSTLNRGVYEHRTVKLQYKSIGQPRPTKREIEPHALCLYDNSIYVLAPEAGTADGPIKTYKLDRISAAELQDSRFTPRTDFDPEKTFDHSIGIYNSGQPEKFRIRVGPERADWAVETMLHPKQRVEPNGDGSLIIEISAAYESEIIPRVLGLAGHAEVLEPAGCREKIGRIGKQLTTSHK